MEDSGRFDNGENDGDAEADSELELSSWGGDLNRGESPSSRRTRAFGEGGSSGLETVVGGRPGYETKMRFESFFSLAREGGVGSVESPEPAIKK